MIFQTLKISTAKLFILLAFTIGGADFLSPASAQLGNITTVSLNGDALNIAIGPDKLVLNICKPDMLRVDYEPDGQSSPETPCISAANWSQVPTKFNIQSDPMTISTSEMKISISRSPCRISVYDSSGKLLIKEQAAKGVYKGGLNLATTNDAHFFGIHGWQYLDWAGSQQELSPSSRPYNIDAGSEGNTGGPFLWSNKGFAVFVDTIGGKCLIPDTKTIEFSGVSRTDVAYYVMVGNAYEVHSLLDQVTGLPPMFPKWALGLFNSEFAGITESIFRSIVDGYRSRGIPFDTYVNDFDWKDWSGDNYGEWHWNPTKFPDGASGALKKEMDARGVKIIGIMKPRIHVDTVQGTYATQNAFWVTKPFYIDYFDHGQVGDLDFSIPACRQWFWEHSEDAFNTGIVGWWNDEADAWGDNLAFMYMAESEYDGQRAYTNNRQRVYTINRNFYTGSQRYAYATWSGDIDSGFAVMRDQRARLLASLNIGQAKWAMDTDGFNNNNHIYGAEASEAYARWIEFDAFVPIFRLHGTSRRQPWLYGPTAQAAATKAIKLRYSLIPYLYAYDRTLNQTGIGICRPLVWDYPDDPNVINDVDAWMFGDYLLAAPVVDEGQTTKQIYLPAGTWTDYFNGKVYDGGQTISYPVNAATWDDIPLFVKSGAIIPTIDVMNYIGEKQITTAYVDVFPGMSTSSFTYYDDDGITYDYEKGAYFSQVMQTSKRPGLVNFNVAPRTGSYLPPLQFYLCKFHGVAAKSVTVNGKRVKQFQSQDDLKGTPGIGWSVGRDVYGPATWVNIPAGDSQKLMLQ